MLTINNIKRFRKEAGKTQQQCAEFLGVTQKGYAWYEQADRIYFDVLLKLSAFFSNETRKVKPEDLYILKQ